MDNVFFIFNDSSLAYSCHHCSGKCCRYHGDFHLLKPYDLVKLIEHSDQTPYLFLNTYESEHNINGVSISPRCWFLREDNDCELEKKGGLASKPLNCILFPVNQWIEINNYLFIDVSMSCPLGIAENADSTYTIINYENSFENIRLAEERTESLYELGYPRYKINQQDFEQLLLIINTLKDYSSKNNPESWSIFLEGLQKALSDNIHFIHQDIPEIHKLYEETYEFRCSANWENNIKINKALALLIPSLFFKWIQKQGHLNKPNIELASSLIQFLLSLISLRYSIEVSTSFGKQFSGIETVTQLANKELQKYLSYLPFVVHFIPSNTITLSVPDHLQPIMQPVFNYLNSKHNDSLADIIKQLKIEPAHANAVLKTIYLNKNNFRFNLKYTKS